MVQSHNGESIEDPVKKWLKFAERDLRSAKRNYEIIKYHVSAFLAQQEAEKALKAMHIRKSVEFPKIIKLCAEITPAYTATRYPDAAEEFNEVRRLN